VAAALASVEDEGDAAAAAALERETAAELAEFSADPAPAPAGDAEADEEDADAGCARGPCSPPLLPDMVGKRGRSGVQVGFGGLSCCAQCPRSRCSQGAGASGARGQREESACTCGMRQTDVAACTLCLLL